MLYPDDPQATVALGFLAAGPWDESSLSDIRDDTVDKKIAQYLDRDDMVTTTMSTFASTTVHCARCHDHKFDPITQADYYGLQAVFAGVDRADRPYDPDPKAESHRRPLPRQEGRARDPEEGGRGPVPRSRRRGRRSPGQAAWEVDGDGGSTAWITLDPSSFKSAGAGDADGARRRLGPLRRRTRPENDTYTIVARTDLKRRSRPCGWRC